MQDSSWIYEVRPSLVLLAVFAFLFMISYLGFMLGAFVQERHPNTSELREFIPSTIFGLLALILAFTFSLAASRFEKRIRLAVDEANAIGTAIRRTSLLKSNREFEARLKRYLQLRIEYYQALDQKIKLEGLNRSASREEELIWRDVARVTAKDRGPIESIFVESLNAVFDLRTARNFLLRARLPKPIYWSILFIAATGVASFNFRRGQRREPGQWQIVLVLLIISLTYTLILDLDRPTAGSIRISQAAMIALRDSLAPPPTNGSSRRPETRQ